MSNNTEKSLAAALTDHRRAGLTEQVDYKKFYLYSVITHSTAIEGSTLTEDETALLFDQGIIPSGHTKNEIFMNEDLKNAYEISYSLAHAHIPYTPKMLQKLSAAVMKNTGRLFSVAQGSYDERNGDFRLLNVHPSGGNSRSYAGYEKVQMLTQQFCEQLNERRSQLTADSPITDIYNLSYWAHYELVSIHPWSDGNGRMSRLIMNQLQEEFGVLPVKVNSNLKQNYIASLKSSRVENTPEIFYQFMTDNHLSNVREDLLNLYKNNNPDYIERKNETVKYAVEYVKSGNGYLWLRDNFNDLCNDTLPDTITDDKTIYRTMIGQEIINRCTPRIDSKQLDTLQKEMSSVMTEVNQGLKR